MIQKFIHCRNLLCPSLIIFFIFTGCSRTIKSSPPPSVPGEPRPYQINGVWYQPRSSAEGFKQKGLASWYGGKFHGRKTANGETYDMHGVSAAHKTLPFNTYVRVYNLDNGKELDVRINDRGPFVKNRIIDLSYTAAKMLGVVGPGTARVKIAALGTVMPRKKKKTSGAEKNEIDYHSGNFTFQINAFVNKENAEKQRDELDKKYINAHIVTHERDGQVFYRVRVGRFSTLEEARAKEGELVRDGYTPMIVAE